MPRRRLARNFSTRPTTTAPRAGTAVIAALLAAVIAVPAGAIQPKRWTHSTEADFDAGESDGVVVTNLGDIKLATATEALGELPEGVSVIYDIETVGDTTYIAAGPEGKLLAVKDGAVEEVAVLEGEQVFTIGGSGLIGISGDKPRIASVADDGSLTTAVEFPEDVRYIWDMSDAAKDENGDEVIFVATGPEGQVFKFGVGTGELGVLLDTAQANVLCLAKGPDGSIYAGTDTDGLIYRIDEAGSAFVVYDAAEAEIGSLLVMEDGTVYAGTAAAEQAKPGRMAAAASEETGRPDAPKPMVGDEGSDTPGDLPVEPAPDPLQQAPAQDAMPPAEAAAETPDAPEAAPAAEVEGSQPSAIDPGDAAEDEPTDEQYDALREEVRSRLQEARKTGTIVAGKGTGPAKPNATRAARSAPTSGGQKQGNAVYRIDPQGFVSEVFRESVMVLKLVALPDGKLLVGTGNEGQLYRIDPAQGETTVLNDLESQQLLALALAEDGSIIVGGANPAALVRLSSDTAAQGVYTSDVLDASQISLWGVLNLTADLPAGTTVAIQTRSGNVADPEMAAWSEWSAPLTLAHDPDAAPLQPREVHVEAPPARFLQYRLTLEHAEPAASATPIIGKVELAYVVPNLRPNVATLTAAYPAFAGVGKPASPTMSVEWTATDDNGDRLLYDLQYRPAGSESWLTLADDQTDTSFEWDTRKVPDGRYHLRVTADDRLDNPGSMALTAGRLGDPVLVDNGAPAAADLAVQQQTDAGFMPATATLTGTASDAFSPIHSVAYSLDDDEQYTPVLPDDLIYDSTSEAFTATLSDLPLGGHVLTVRVIDGRGNTTYASKLFEVK